MLLLIDQRIKRFKLEIKFNSLNNSNSLQFKGRKQENCLTRTFDNQRTNNVYKKC